MGEPDRSDSKAEIIRADEKDITSLIELCRINFAEDVWWYGPRFVARSWWSFMLSAPSAETYIMYQKNNAVGFYLIVSDLKSFKGYASGTTIPKKILYSMRYLGLLTHPRHAMTTIRNFIRRLAKLEDIRWQDNVDLDKVVWAAWHAISPEYRRTGMSKIFMNYITNRTIELQKEMLVGSVEPDNIKIMNLLESIGWKRIGKTGREIVYGRHCDVH
jgi:hypothetical protein